MAVISEQQVYDWLAAVTDPEVPVLTITDLGIIRDVDIQQVPDGGAEVTITITPTYSGCPAMDVIGMNIRFALLSHGIRHVHIKNQLSPAWTTDWMTDEGKRKLKEYGIAPPQRRPADPLALFGAEAVPCPRCNATETELVSQFGATACKSLYRCLSCHEPFEYFKCH
jgi:ring-1,2-phenylacetyl-CoA epoxidase subunit PaaD